jgi:hypothetical protein
MSIQMKVYDNIDSVFALLSPVLNIAAYQDSLALKEMPPCP